MSAHDVSDRLVAHRNHLEKLSRANRGGDVRLISEDVAALIEELTSANAELQSLNRKLETRNAEVARLYEDLRHTNLDLKHLIDNMNVPVLFVDNELRVSAFTPRITEIIPLSPIDRGRRLTDFVPELGAFDLVGDLTAVLRTGVGIEHEVVVGGAGKSHTAVMRINPCRDGAGGIQGAILSFVDALHSGSPLDSAHYAALARASGDGIIGMSVEGVVRAWNPGAERLLGYTASEMIGKSKALLAPAGYEHEFPQLLEQVRNGKEIAPYDTVRRRKDGTLVQVAIRAAPILSQDGVPIGISETMRAITRRKQAEEHTALLMRELAHRTKNLLSLVHATMVQTAEHSTSKENFIKNVDARLHAMSQAHDLLIANNMKGTLVADLVRSSLKPFLAKDESLQMQGPPVLLQADVVHNLSLVLHELATNAMKYGALTQPQGKVLVSWSLDRPEASSPRFRISWREMDGPPVSPPRRKGFGTSVVSEAPKFELGAEVALVYERAGLLWSLDMSAERALGEAATTR